MIVVGRLRKDAALHTVPEVVDPKKRKRGQPRKYGKERISLAKRAGHHAGWQADEFVLYHKKVQKTYKTFLATYEPVGGKIRVVLVKVKRDARLVRLFLHQGERERSRDCGSGGRPGSPRAELSRRERSAWRRSATIAKLLGEPRGLPWGLVVAHAAGAMGLAQGAGGTDRPQRQSVGQGTAPSFARGSP